MGSAIEFDVTVLKVNLSTFTIFSFESTNLCSLI
jgi:hypothetical protein